MSSQHDEPADPADLTDVGVVVPDSPEGVRSLQSWSTARDVMDHIDAHVQLTMRSAVTTATALGLAEASYQDAVIIRSAQRPHLVQAIRRIEALAAGLGVCNGHVLAAAAVMYLCNHGLRTTLNLRIDPPEHAGTVYEQLGGDRTARIAETASVLNSVRPDGRSLRRSEPASRHEHAHEQDHEPEYKRLLDKLAADHEALLVLLADNYAFGDIFSLMRPADARNVYRQTKYDLLPLAAGTPGIDDLFGPWLELYAGVDRRRR